MSVGLLVCRSVGLSVCLSVCQSVRRKKFLLFSRAPSFIKGEDEVGARRRRAPVSSRAPSLIKEGARRTGRGPGGGEPPPSVSSRAPSLNDEEEDKKGDSRTRACILTK